MNLDDLLQRADVWRGGTAPPPSGLASGYPALDALLSGGWPQGALVEILSAQRGIGELRLLLPTLVRVTQGQRWLAFVAPPYLPYAPALARAGVQLAHVLQIHPRSRADALWAVEQTLRSGTCGVVCAWLQQADGKSLRRLQLAAEAGDSLGFLFRDAAAAHAASPAAVRVQLSSAPEGSDHLIVNILKRRGGWPTGPVAVEIGHALALSAFSDARA
jgi:cell division inhibitor SulA